MKHTISLKENHVFRRMYHRARSTAGRHLVLYCQRNRLGYNRLGLTVSAKLANAVGRNRVKRLLREAYRLHEEQFSTGVDIVLVARSRAVGAHYVDIERSLLRALQEHPVAAAKR
ncbi:MAG: ribonuclease P protein component [Eubacteriales bacterium]|nr:ribonuclease P protein component [Eubacteriales bacterium]